jgi:hypothetical protein
MLNTNFGRDETKSCYTKSPDVPVHARVLVGTYGIGGVIWQLGAGGIRGA